MSAATVPDPFDHRPPLPTPADHPLAVRHWRRARDVLGEVGKVAQP